MSSEKGEAQSSMYNGYLEVVHVLNENGYDITAIDQVADDVYFVYKDGTSQHVDNIRSEDVNLATVLEDTPRKHHLTVSSVMQVIKQEELPITEVAVIDNDIVIPVYDVEKNLCMKKLYNILDTFDVDNLVLAQDDGSFEFSSGM